jgi:hypothetical protein
MPYKNSISGFHPLGQFLVLVFFYLFYISWSQFLVNSCYFRPVQCQILLRGDAECAKRQRKRSRRGGAGRLRQRGGKVVRAAHCRVAKCAQQISTCAQRLLPAHRHSVYAGRGRVLNFHKQAPNALIKKKKKSSSFIRKFRWDQLPSLI